MGNTINVKHSEETETLEVTDKLIRDFQYHINLVDRSIVGFARSIDSMRSSCAVFKRDTDAVDVDVSNGKYLHDGSEAGFLLETIDNVLSDHKFIALESLSRFFTFILDNGSHYFTSDYETMLSVDKYRLQNSSNGGLNKKYYDARIESLQNKVETLKKDYQSAKEDIELFNERELLYFDEKNSQSEKDDLESETARMKLELKKTLDAKITVEQRNEKLKNEIKAVRWCEKKVQSQKEEKALEEVKILYKNIDKLNADFNEFKQKHEEMTNVLTKGLEQEKREKEKTIEKLKDVKDGKRQSEEEKNGIIENASLMENEIQRLTTDVKEKQTEIQSLEEKHRTEMDAIFKEKTKLQQDLKEKQTKADEMETRLQSLQEANSNLSLMGAQITEFMTTTNDEIKLMNANLKENYTLTAFLNKEREANREAIKEYVKQLEDLKSAKQHRKEVNLQQEKKISELTECLQQEQRENEELSKELEDLKYVKSQSEVEKKGLSEKINSLESEIQKLSADIKEKQTEIQSLEEKHRTEMDAILKEKTKLQQDFKEKQTKADEMDTRLQSLQNANIDISLIETKITEFMTTTTDEIRTMNTNLKENHTLTGLLNNEREANTEANKAYVKQLEDLKSTKLHQKEVNIQQEKKINELADCLEQEQREKEEISKELENLKYVKSQTEVEKKGLFEKILSLESEIKHLTADVKENQTEIESIDEKHRTEMDAILKEKTKLQQDLKEKQTKADEMETRLQSLQEANTNLTLMEARITDLMTTTNYEIKTLYSNLKEKNMVTAFWNKERKTNEDDVKQLEDFKSVQLHQKVVNLQQEERINVPKKCLKQREKDDIGIVIDDLKDRKSQFEVEKKGLFIREVNLLESEIQNLTADVKENQIQVDSLEEKHRTETGTILKEETKLQQDVKEKQTKADKIVTRLQSLQEGDIKLSLIEAKIIDFLTKIDEEIKTMNTNLKEHHDLTNCLEDERTTNKVYVKQLEKFKALQHQEEMEKTSKDVEINLLQREIIALTTDLTTRKKEIESLEKKHKYEMDGCIQDIEKLKHDNKEQREIIEEQVDKIKSLNELELDLTSKLKNETDTRSSLMESKTDAITSLKEDIERMSKESSDLKLLHEADRHSLEQSLEKDRGEKEDCLKQVNELKEKQSQNCDIINNMNDEKRRLQTDIEEKENEIKSLQIKLQLASRKVINVQVRHLSWFHAADVEKELQHILKTRMATEFIDLQFLTCPEAYLVHSDLPLFIVCSRRYTYKRDQNISIAIKGLKGTWKKAALLMFHDREWRSLQNEVDNRIDDVKNIGEIFDIGHKSKIYVSDTNSRNIDGMIEFLKREGLQKSSDRESAV